MNKEKHAPSSSANPGNSSQAQPSSPEDVTPFVPAEAGMAESTLLALILGVVLAVVMGAANTYLGLYAGMTVSASIPAAVISMGILRGLLRRGTILENNIVQTVASTGESLSAGVIFTVPALIITGAWDRFHYWEVTLICLLGGTLGIIFMIPIRWTLIVKGDKELIYPEGIACAEVLKAGEKGGSSALYILLGLMMGGFMKSVTGWFKWLPGLYKNGFFQNISGKSTVFAGGVEMSLALGSVGYIVGLQISTLVFLGGALGWLVAIPLASYFWGIPAEAGTSAYGAAETLWADHIRFIGVGAMLVGGLWSIISVRKGIFSGISAVFGQHTKQRDKRTEKDMHGLESLSLLLLAAGGVFGLYLMLTGSAQLSLVMMILMIVAAFFFVAVSSYIVGLVGSSNNPVSGMTITTMLFASGLLVLFGFKGDTGIVAALGIAGVVCCAACTAGDVSQDLKTGHLLGATPRSQQWAEILGVAIPAFTIAPILALLHDAYGIGAGTPLKAPQASLFASLAEGFFKGGDIPWPMVYIGLGLGVVLVMLNEILKRTKSSFRTHCMPVAVGIYLPMELSVPIFLGGILHWLVSRMERSKQNGMEGENTTLTHLGTLLASGMIAGEAIMGIIIAILLTMEKSGIWPFTG